MFGGALAALWLIKTTMSLWWGLADLAAVVVALTAAYRLRHRQSVCVLGILCLIILGANLSRTLVFTDPSLRVDLQQTTANPDAAVYHVLEENSRLSIWRAALPWFKDYPVLGSGPESTGLLYPHYRPATQLALSTENLDRLHNQALDFLTTRGLPGLLMYYGWMLWFFLRLEKKIGKDPALSALLAGWLAFHVQALFLFGFTTAWIWLFFWMLMLEVRAEQTHGT